MIPTSYFWLNIFCLSIGTFSIRFSIVSISGRLKITERAKELFSYIPSAILPALITPMVFFHKGLSSLVFGKERLVVLLFSTAVCYLTRSTFLTIVFGLLALYGFKLF